MSEQGQGQKSKCMIKTKKADSYFIVLATVVWISALIVTAWDFIKVQQATYRFGLFTLLGLGSTLLGVTIRLWARKTLGVYFSASLRTVETHELITHGIYKYVRHPAYTGNFLF